MPGSNKTERNRALKANRAAGIGDEMGRIVRVKDPGVTLVCTICKAELKCTKVRLLISLFYSEVNTRDVLY